MKNNLFWVKFWDKNSHNVINSIGRFHNYTLVTGTNHSNRSSARFAAHCVLLCCIFCYMWEGRGGRETEREPKPVFLLFGFRGFRQVLPQTLSSPLPSPSPCSTPTHIAPRHRRKGEAKRTKSPHKHTKWAASFRSFLFWIHCWWFVYLHILECCRMCVCVCLWCFSTACLLHLIWYSTLLYWSLRFGCHRQFLSPFSKN